MTTIALIGAGGKMGCRLTDNFSKSAYDVRYVEVSQQGIQNLESRGKTCSDAHAVVPESDVVILAVPDVAIGKVAADLVPKMKHGFLLMTLDPAVPLADWLPKRTELGCVIAHPCHPSVFNWEPTEKDFRDFYGGITAKQAIVVALMWGR